MTGLSRLAFAAVVCLAAPVALLAQPDVASSKLVAPQASAVGEDVPPINGLNFVVSTSSQYDGLNGWSSELSPTLSFRLNRFLSFDTSVPFYVAVNAQLVKGTKAVPVYVPTTAHGVLGDTGVAAHFDLDGSWLSYSFTASGAFPTGNSTYNLSANTPTYEVNNHFEHSIGIFTPDIELGEGNSTSLAGTVRKAYVAVGPVAFFQAGTSVDLTHKMNLEVEAYEAMPIGNQKVYGTVTTKKGKTVTVLQGTGVAEDNGFNTSFTFPLTPHLDASVFYNRSLRQYDNTTGFSFTYTARVPKSTTR